MKRLKDEKYQGFTIRFEKSGGVVHAFLKSAPKNIGPVDTYSFIGTGYTKDVAFKQAKDRIDLELEGLYRAYNYAPRFGGF